MNNRGEIVTTLVIIGVVALAIGSFFFVGGNGNLTGMAIRGISSVTLNFVDPTPAANISEDYIYVNLSTSSASEHYSFVDFNNDLVLWMRMDDVNGSGDPTDLSSYGNNGSLSGAVINSSSGYYGNGGFFDGSDDRIIVSDSSSLDSPGVTDELTLCSWIKVDVHGSGYKGIVGKWSAERQYLLVKDDTTNKYGLLLSRDGLAHTTNGAELFTDAALNTGQWYHLCGTYNGSNMYIYLDGEKQSGTADSGGINDASTAYLEIGSFNQGTAFTFDGSVDEVMIWNRDLSLAEIKALYNSSVNQYENNFTDLGNETYTFTGYGVDSSGVDSISRTITTGVITGDQDPQITLNSPTDAGTEGDYVVNFNVTVTDDNNLINVSLFGNWTGSFVLDDTNSSGVNGNYIFSKNLSSYGEGTYLWGITAYDNESQQTISSNRTFMIDIPTQVPNITLLSSTYQENTFIIQINTSNAATSCWFTLDNGTTNTTMFETDSQNFYYEDFDAGILNTIFYCQNAFGIASYQDNFEFRNVVSFENVYYTNSQGLKIYFDFYFNDTSETGKVIMFPDSWSQTKDDIWIPQAEVIYLPEGYVTVPINTRGKGSSQGTRDILGYECLDIYELFEELKTNLDYSPYISDSIVYLFGASYGGGKVGVCTARYPDLFAAGYSAVGVLNMTLWYENPSYAASIASGVGCTPSQCPEAYLARDASYMNYNTQTAVAVSANQDDGTVTIGCSRDYNVTMVENGKTINYTEYASGGHSDFHLDYAMGWFANHISEPILPTNGTLRIGGYLKTKNFTIDLQTINYSAEVDYNISGEDKEFNITTGDFSGEVNIIIEDLVVSTEYNLVQDGEGIFIDSDSNGVINTNISLVNDTTSNITLSIAGEYCGDSSCNNDETCSTCATDCGACSSGGSGGGGGSSTNTVVNTLVSLGEAKLELSHLSYLLIDHGETKDLTLKTTNIGSLFLNDCKLNGKGDYASWISSNEIKDLSPGEIYEMNFRISIPENGENGIFEIELELECLEIKTSMLFNIEILEKKIDFALGEFNRIGDNEIQISYTLKELSGVDQNLNLQFLLLDKNNNKVAETSDNIPLSSNTEKEYSIIIPVSPELKGELTLLVNLNSETYSSFVKEEIVLSPISGFTIFGESKGTDKILSWVFVGGFALFAIFIIARIIIRKR